MGFGIAVDKLIYINLDSRDDRRAHMERQLAQCPWPLERLSATRLETLPEDAGIKMHPMVAGQRGVASIWLSHKNSLTQFLRYAKKGAFVLLEDDVVIFDEFWATYSKVLSSLPSNWEIALLTPKYRYRNAADIPENQQGKRFARSPNGSRPVFLPEAAKKYLISGAHFCVFRNADVVMKVIEKMEKIDGVYDVDRFYVMNFNSYGIKSHHISSGGFGSDHRG